MDKDTFVEAAGLLERALDDAATNPGLLVQTLLSLTFAQGMSGKFEESLQNARQAVSHAEEFGYPPLIGRALAMLVNASFLYGHGVDEDSLRRAVELEDPDDDVPIPFSPSAVNALICAWTGELNIARRQMAAVRDRCVERGAENDLMAVAGYCRLIEIWHGSFAEDPLLPQCPMELSQKSLGRSPS